MPRYRRSFRSSRRARQTNWLAGHTGALSLGNDAFDTQALLKGEAYDELQHYTNPTLTRIVGHIYFDPQFNANAGSQFAYVIFNIWVGDTSTGITWGSDQGDVLDGALSSDSILWVGGCRAGQYRGDLGTPNNQALILPQQTSICDVDIKAQRRLEDTREIFVTAVNPSGSGNIGVEWGFTLRCLITE